MGCVGKENFLMNRFFSYAMVLLVTGCATADTLVARRTLAIYGYEGRWAGGVTPTSEHCGSAAKGVLTIAAESFVLDPFQGTTVIHGTFDPGTGQLSGSFARPRGGSGIPGATGVAQAPAGRAKADDGPVLSISFAGQAAKSASGAESVTGTLTSGRCSWNVDLGRA
jgi:hypothetical protein